ncbi:MAG: ABC-type multidrug transport system, ATPase and permease component [Bacilli bacterium]|nr:ABC-type multidrug transport system, ATPase and permease component [Bacilli bacterium]
MGKLGGGAASNAPKATLKEVKLTRVLGLFKHYWAQLSIILVLALSSAFVGLGPPLVMKEIVDKAIPHANYALLFKMVGLMVGLPMLNGLLGVTQNYLNNKVGQGVMFDLRHALLSNLQKQSISFFTNSRSGEIIQRLTGDVQAVQGVVTGTIVSAISQVVVIFSSAFILFRLDWKLACISLCILPVFVFPVRKVANTRKQLRAETRIIAGQMSAHLAEIFGVSGAMLTRIFGRESLQEKRFTQLNQKSMQLELKLNLVGRWYNLFMNLLNPLGTAIIYLYGGYFVMKGSMTLGGIIAFAAYLNRLYGPITSLLNLHVDVTTALGIFKRIFEYLDLKPEISDHPNARTISTVSSHLAFRSVSFSYQKEQHALQNITFEIKPGQLVALVGHSGAGKSTLINLIGRLYDPDEGHLEIDGLDIRQINLQSLREQIAYVTQESFLFHATIRDNLLFARDDANQEEIEQACRQSFIHDFILSLPDGYDSIVGERGHRLSGGERQRLAIARAILKNPNILILDEATSHLDSESEVYVQSALEGLQKNRTTLVIAHRLSTVLKADKILVMDKGKLTEQGTHTELLKLGGRYAGLYHTQFAGSTASGSSLPQQ